MATTKSELFAKFDRVHSIRPDSIEADGRIRYLNDTIIFEGGETTNAEVDLMPLPKGALVDLAKSTIVGGAMTGVTVHVGCNESTDNLADTLSLNAAGTRVFDASAPGLIEVTDAALKLIIAGGTTDADDTQRISIAYYIR